jgi:hypothetical protein
MAVFDQDIVKGVLTNAIWDILRLTLIGLFALITFGPFGQDWMLLVTFTAAIGFGAVFPKLIFGSVAASPWRTIKKRLLVTIVGATYFVVVLQSVIYISHRNFFELYSNRWDDIFISCRQSVLGGKRIDEHVKSMGRDIVAVVADDASDYGDAASVLGVSGFVKENPYSRRPILGKIVEQLVDAKAKAIVFPTFFATSVSEFNDSLTASCEYAKSRAVPVVVAEIPEGFHSQSRVPPYEPLSRFVFSAPSFAYFRSTRAIGTCIAIDADARVTPGLPVVVSSLMRRSAGRMITDLSAGDNIDLNVTTIDTSASGNAFESEILSKFVVPKCMFASARQGAANTFESIVIDSELLKNEDFRQISIPLTDFVRKSRGSLQKSVEGKIVLVCDNTPGSHIAVGATRLTTSQLLLSSVMAIQHADSRVYYASPVSERSLVCVCIFGGACVRWLCGNRIKYNDWIACLFCGVVPLLFSCVWFIVTQNMFEGVALSLSAVAGFLAIRGAVELARIRRWHGPPPTLG